MIELIVDTVEACEALSAKIDTAKKLPCCACEFATDPNCTCQEHKYSNGKDAPHHETRGVTYATIIRHKTDPTLAAYPVDVVVRDVAEKGAPTIDDRTRAEIAAAVDAAVPVTADWVKEDPPAVKTTTIK